MAKEGSDDELKYLRSEVRRLRRSIALLTPGIEMLLKRRGFLIYRKEPADDLLMPHEQALDNYYGMLRKYSFRLFLRVVIKNQDFFTRDMLVRYASPEVTSGYLKFLVRTGIAEPRGKGYSLSGPPVKSFGETLEWYVAEIFRREFCTESLWGVKFKRPRVGGDYDVIAKIDGSIIYVEAKSSPPRQIYQSEISAFLDSTGDLLPELSVFLMDTELRMKDKIVPMFEEEFRKRGSKDTEAVRIERELFHIGDRIFIINAKDSILSNLEKVISIYLRR